MKSGQGKTIEEKKLTNRYSGGGTYRLEGPEHHQGSKILAES
jgi:hypothetical protein